MKGNIVLVHGAEKGFTAICMHFSSIKIRWHNSFKSQTFHKTFLNGASPYANIYFR